VGKGHAEGLVFEKIAEDKSRRPAVRGWAYQALKKTPLCNQGRAMEGALVESDGHVRRAMVVTLRDSGGSTLRNFLSDLEAQLPGLKYTRRWLEAA
jgi:hypothetical protein